MVPRFTSMFDWGGQHPQPEATYQPPVPEWWPNPSISAARIHDRLLVTFDGLGKKEKSQVIYLSYNRNPMCTYSEMAYGAKQSFPTPISSFLSPLFTLQLSPRSRTTSIHHERHVCQNIHPPRTPDQPPGFPRHIGRSTPTNISNRQHGSKDRRYHRRASRLILKLPQRLIRTAGGQDQSRAMRSTS